MFRVYDRSILICWQLSLTDILSELALLYIILWHTGWEKQTLICSRVLRMVAHRKEIPVDKKLHRIREQTEWENNPRSALYLLQTKST